MGLLTRLFGLVICALLPSLGVQIYNEIEARQARAHEGQEQALRTVRLIADEQSRVFEAAHELLTSLGKISASAQSTELCDTLFTELQRSYPQYTDLTSINLVGQPICSSNQENQRRPSGNADYFKLALHRNSFVIGSYFVHSTTRTASIYVAQPFYSADDAVAGVVAAGIGIDWLNREIAAKDLPSKSTVSMVDRHGTILVRHPGAHRFVGQSIPGGSHAYLLSGGEGVQDALGFDGIPRIYAYAPLPNGPSGVTISVGLEKAEILKGVAAANRRGLLVIPAEAALAFLLAGIGARVFLRRRLLRLLTVADRLRQGDLRARADMPEDRSEFGRLGAAFDTMADAVAAREEQLEARVAQRSQELQVAMAAQQAAEAALYQAHKMEAIGRLTGGVAHDFNNLLAAVVGNLELALTRLDATNPLTTRIRAALSSAQRGARLTQYLLSFARRQTLRPEVVDMNQYLGSLLDVLKPLLRPDITVEATLTPDTWPVRVDPSQLEAAILNLAINARDAMPPGGCLRIETLNVTLIDGKGPDGLHGDFVALTVRDNGTGIPPEHLDKVFEPFFTTKEVGKGSGLGLSMVHGFARQSAGSVAIESTVGVGTTVTLYLPRTHGQPTVPERGSATLSEGHGTILLVDDDDDVRQVMAVMLRQLGYAVLEAAAAAEALKLLAARRHAVDLLITDIVLTGPTTGLSLARTIRQSQPDIPVVIITGYSEALTEGAMLQGALILSKPFEFSRLADVVRAALTTGQQGDTIVSPASI
ncbi:MAG: hypothetical protein B7Z80_04310 [Rhodospirillales bacterium 20-64-7]|nr:MAG: hypothetical protein B7Z80_04310 [Rhodospirillales bacterium 20-64-7]